MDISSINKMKNFDPNSITGTDDIMFRSIMSEDKDILKAIIEVSLNTKIDDIVLLSSELNKDKYLDMKKTLDVYSKSNDMLYDVEMTNNYNETIKKRNLAFGFKVYLDAVARGSNYDDYKPVCVLNLIGGIKNKDKHYTSYLKNEKNVITTKMFRYSEIFIDNYIERYYNVNDEENIRAYKYIIMLGLNLKELEKFYEKYGDDIVKKYKDSFTEKLLAKPFEPLFEYEEDQRRINESNKILARREGLAEGLAEGSAKKEIELASKMLKAKIPLNKVSHITGIPINKLMML